MTDNNFEFTLNDEQQTVQYGQSLATLLTSNNQKTLVVYLYGELGAGKTTLVRGILQGLGHAGSTKSPTYTLVEPYQLKDTTVYHFDLYRLADPDELEFIGIREYIEQNAILLFEWPDKGAGMIPVADITLELCYLEQGRRLSIKANNIDLQQKLASMPVFVPKLD